MTTQLAEMGIPMVAALNMIDVVRRQGGTIDAAALSDALGFPVVETSAIKGEGIPALMEAAKRASGGAQPPAIRFPDVVEDALSQIGALVSDVVDGRQLRWFSVKLFERDEKVLARFHFSGTPLHADVLVAASCTIFPSFLAIFQVLQCALIIFHVF